MRKIILLISLVFTTQTFAYGINSIVSKDENPDKIDRARISEDVLSDPYIKDKSIEDLSKKYTLEEIRYIKKISEDYGNKTEIEPVKIYKGK